MVFGSLKIFTSTTTYQCIPQVGFGEGSVYAALPLPCESREVVSSRPSMRRKYSSEASHADNDVDECSSNNKVIQ